MQEVTDAPAGLVVRDGDEPEATGNTTDSVLGLDQFKTSVLVPVEDKFVISKCSDETLHSCVQCLLVRQIIMRLFSELFILYFLAEKM